MDDDASAPLCRTWVPLANLVPGENLACAFDSSFRGLDACLFMLAADVPRLGDTG